MEQHEATVVRQDQLYAARRQPLQLPLRLKFTADLRGPSNRPLGTGRASSDFTSEQYFRADTAVEHQRREDRFFSSWRASGCGAGRQALPGQLRQVEGLNGSFISSNSQQTSGKSANRCSSRNSVENYVSHSDTEADQPRFAPINSRQVIANFRCAHTYGAGSSARARSLRADQADSNSDSIRLSSIAWNSSCAFSAGSQDNRSQHATASTGRRHLSLLHNGSTPGLKPALQQFTS